MLDFESVLKNVADAEGEPMAGMKDPVADPPAAAGQGPRSMVDIQFSNVTRHVARIVADAESLEISDADRLDFAVSLAGECKKTIKGFEIKQKEITQGAKDFIDSVRGFVGRFTDRLKGAETVINQKVSNYKLQLDITRKKQEALAKAAAENLQKKLNEEAEKAGVEAPQVPELVIPKEKAAIKSSTGTTAYEVKRWICTVQDPAQVPRQYCEPVKKLLDEAVKMGIREIPGCKIEEITETRFRA